MDAETVEGFRLSSQQRHIWKSLQNGSTDVYKVQGSLLIQGTIARHLLENVLEKTICKYEILHTVFPRVPGMLVPLQVVNEDAFPCKIEYSSSDLASEDPIERAAALYTAALNWKFDLQQGPFWRATLSELSPNCSLFILAIHALCADAITMRLLLEEIGQSYLAMSGRDNSSPLGEPVQFIDFSEWQNTLLEDGDTYRESRKKLLVETAESSLALRSPLEQIGDANGTVFSPASTSFSLDDAEETMIRECLQKYSSSLSAFLLANWHILLWRLTGVAEVTVGVNSNSRCHEGLEDVIGPLTSYFPVHCSLEEDRPFSALLQEIEEGMQKIPDDLEYFDWELVEADPSRNITTNFFPACFDFYDAFALSLAHGSISFNAYRQDDCLDRFDLKLSCTYRPGQSVITLFYDAEKFSAATATAILGHFRTLLASAALAPDAQAGSLNIMSEEQRKQVLYAFNEAGTREESDQCVHQLFAQQAARVPDTIAVMCEDQRITYAELEARSNQLARYLQKQGVGPEVIVALGVPRSVEMILGILGILKAGGAYVPLDPTLPHERLAFMLHDTQARLLLTQAGLAARYPDTDMPVVFLDSGWEEIARESRAPLPASPSAENAAYVIFTSGSTGRPKGVVVEHRQLAHYVACLLEYLQLDAAIRSFALISSPGTDLGYTALYPCLCSGRTLHILSQERASHPEAFAEYQRQHAIDVLKIAPSHLTALLAASHPEQILPRRYLIIGGEALSWELIRKLLTLAPHCTIVNHYGPTETTIGTITYRVQSDHIQSKGTLPLGRPLAGSQVYILDRYLQPVPPMVGGELYIAGRQVSRGYLQREDLTRERFLPDPFRTGQRMYKTGDAGRYLPDGTIEFLGRVDNQIKIRGFRVEPGEIEAVLEQLPAVAQAVVTSQALPPDDQQLVAYLVVEQKETEVPDHQAIFEFLKTKLPEYMLPGDVVFVEALPLTPSGKVDRQALAGLPRHRSRAAFVPPRNLREMQLAQIWEDVLHTHPIGITQNFFSLGGHSLLAIRLLVEIEQQFGRRLSLADLLQFATIETLAQQLDQGVTAPVPSPIVTIQAHGQEPPFFCVHPGGGNVLCYLDLAHALGTTRPFYGIQARGIDSRQEPLTSIEDMAHSYIEAVRSVQAAGPYFLGGWSMGGVIAFEMARQLQQEAQQVAFLALLDSPLPFVAHPSTEHGDGAFVAQFITDLQRLLAIPLDPASIAHLAPEEQLQALLERAKSVHAFAPDTDFEQLTRLFRLFQINVRALNMYRPRAYAGTATLFLAQEEGQRDSRGLISAWQDLAQGGLLVEEIPGDHYTLLNETHAPFLARRLNMLISTAHAFITNK